MSNVKTNVTQDAAVRLMLKFPYWSELYYGMTIYGDANIPTLCTDGRNMWVNPEFWKTLTLPLKVSALAHEVGHKMLLHCSRRGHRHPMLWNIAADYVVNAILAENGFELGKDWLFEEKYIGWAVEAVYHDIEQKAQQKPQGGGNGKGEKSKGQAGGEQESPESNQGNGNDAGGGEDDPGESGQPQHGSPQAGHGDLDVPGVSQQWKDKYQDLKDELTAGMSKEEVEKFEKEVMEQVEKAIMTAKAHGSAPAGMKAFDDVMKPSKEPWYNHLHRYMQSLSMAEYNWARINRRHLVQHSIFTPDNYSEALEHVVFAIDCSGSVFNAASQAGFAGHVNAILAEAKPKKTHVIYFDSHVTEHEELDYGQLDFSTHPKGGGGTDFRPVFRYLEDEGITPEVCVFLTDCYGDYPKDEPEYPVIWASIIDPAHLGHYGPPFGDVIHVEED